MGFPELATSTPVEFTLFLNLTARKLWVKLLKRLSKGFGGD